MWVALWGLAIATAFLLCAFTIRLVALRRIPRNRVNGQLRVCFLHPDLGIGGAERLVVDSAIGLQRRGHYVHFFTTHHDPHHCFPETINGTLPVTVYGDFLPRTIFAWLLRSDTPPFDIVFTDQIPAPIPLLRLKGAPVLFYCHHPDLLLTERKSFLKRLYRMPLDLLEEVTTGMADRVLVNSVYTQSVYTQTFRRLRTVPTVLYPCINFSDYTTKPSSSSSTEKTMFFSLNRYERKKNIGLALRAFAQLLTDVGRAIAGSLELVVAGGYDPQLRENVEHYAELRQLASELGLREGREVRFLRSIPPDERNRLLAVCFCVLYTPANEHFGIVPVEAMYAGKPVIACNSGGPLESIRDRETGFLCNPEPAEFVAAMKTLLLDRELAARMGENAHRHAAETYSLDSYAKRLEQIMQAMVQGAN